MLAIWYFCRGFFILVWLDYKLSVPVKQVLGWTKYYVLGCYFLRFIKKTPKQLVLLPKLVGSQVAKQEKVILLFSVYCTHISLLPFWNKINSVTHNKLLMYITVKNRLSIISIAHKMFYFWDVNILNQTV